MDAKRIGERLQMFRIEKGESQEDVAKELGLTPSAVSQYETGLRIPSDEIKIKYSQHFDKTVQSLFYEQEEV